MVVEIPINNAAAEPGADSGIASEPGAASRVHPHWMQSPHFISVANIIASANFTDTN